jgi:hypothetical protein
LAIYKQRVADLLVPESFKEGDGICLKKPNLKPNEVPTVYFKVQRIKWMSDGKGCTIFAGKHSVRKPKGFDSAILYPPTSNPNPVKVLIKTPSIYATRGHNNPVEFGDAEPPL